MPLDTSGSKESVGKNIAELETNGTRPRSHTQIVAIALNAARKGGAKIPPPSDGRYRGTERKK